MARLPQAANTEGNDEGLQDFTPLPFGKYVAVIKKSEWKQTKAKTGNYLELQWEVIEGDYKGRLLFDRLNLDNPNPVAVQIANKALNSICKACDLVGVEDSEEIHEIPVLLDVRVQEATEQNPASNNIRGYESPTGNRPEEATTEAGTETGSSEEATQPSAATSTKEKLPWE